MVTLRFPFARPGVSTMPRAAQALFLSTMALSASLISAAGQEPPQPIRAGDSPVQEIKPGRLRVAVNERGVIEASRTATAICRVEGGATIIKLVPEGSAVKRGDVVCELDSATLRDRLTNQEIAKQRAGASYLNAKLAREAAEIAVVEYVEGIFKQEVYALKSQIAGAQAAIQKAEV